MRVLIFTTALKSDAAGVQGVVNGLTEHLREAGHDVVTAWPDGDGTSRDWRLDLMTDVGRGGRPGPAALVRGAFDLAALAARLYRFRPDVVNLHYPRGQTLYFNLLRRVFGFRVVLSFHGSDYHKAGEAVAPCFPQWMRKADEVTAVSAALAKGLAGLAPDVPVTVIPNGVDTGFWTPARGEQREPGLIVAAGRLLPVKGFDVLLNAMAAEGAENARLVIAGEGPDESALREQMQALGIEDRVELAGRLDRHQLRDLFRRADLFVLPSRREGMPLVLLEAMATGLPAVVTRVGGVPQVMVDGAGEVVPPQDPEALAGAIGRRLGCTRSRAEESAKARERALLFAADATYRQYEAALEADRQAGEGAGSSVAATRSRNTPLSAASLS